MQLLVWGFFVSTIAVYHVTYLVNSATHLVGTRRYETKDDSKDTPHWINVDSKGAVYVGFVSGNKVQKWVMK